MTPQVINAGKIRLHYPTSKPADEHFENLRREFADALQRLRALVDDAIDTADFIKASGMHSFRDRLSNNHSNGVSEEAMRRYTGECEDAIRGNQPPKVVDSTSNIARLGNRVLMAAKNEADNSEDPHFVNNINNAANRLQDGMPWLLLRS